MNLRTLTADDLTGPVISVASAGVLLAVGFGPGPATTAFLGVALGLVALRIVWQDLSDFTIPDAATLAFGVLALTARLCEGSASGVPIETTVGLIALDGGLCGGMLLALRELYYRRRGHDGIGLGDVKLAAAGGILVGTIGFSFAILGASLLGLVLVLIARLRPTAGPTLPMDRVAFGAILAPALWVTWLVGDAAVASGHL